VFYYLSHSARPLEQVLNNVINSLECEKALAEAMGKVRKGDVGEILRRKKA
jgi:hypothetical protein